MDKEKQFNQETTLPAEESAKLYYCFMVTLFDSLKALTRARDLYFSFLEDLAIEDDAFLPKPEAQEHFNCIASAIGRELEEFAGSYGTETYLQTKKGQEFFSKKVGRAPRKK